MDILLTGSVAYDYLMTFPGYFREHLLPEKLESISLSFLVDSMVRLRGGIAPNIAYTLALLGGRPRLWATVGEDFEEYRQYLEQIGVDTSGARVVPGVFTASYFATTDRSNAQLASFYPGAMAYAGELSLSELEGERPDLVVISPNDPAAMRRYVDECHELELPYIYDPSQQIVRMTGAELKHGIVGALALFVNDYEFALAQKMTDMAPADLLASLHPAEQAFMVVTRGEKGSTVFTADGVVDIPVFPPECIADPTGVGDAFRGGFLTAYSCGLDLETCGRVGALAATYCLEHKGPQAHAYTPAEFVARFRRHYGDQGKLDVLLANERRR
jgi:adenosine kinase